MRRANEAKTLMAGRRLSVSPVRGDRALLTNTTCVPFPVPRCPSLSTAGVPKRPSVWERHDLKYAIDNVADPKSLTIPHRDLAVGTPLFPNFSSQVPPTHYERPDARAIDGECSRLTVGLQRETIGALVGCSGLFVGYEVDDIVDHGCEGWFLVALR